MDKKWEIDKRYLVKAIINADGFCLYKDKPFVSVSGLRELFFLDHRLLYASPEARDVITNGMVKLIRENFESPDVIVGVAIGALPLATIVAEKLRLPLAYVRPKLKDHGRERLVEGVILKGSKALIIEDVVVKATSSINAYHAILSQKASVLGIVSIYNQKLDAMFENLENLKLKNVSLYDIDDLLEISKEIGYLTQQRYDEINAWRKDTEHFFDNK